MSPAEPEPLLETLLQRLEDSWDRGQPLFVESLLRDAEGETLSEDDLLQLVYSEIDVRTERGEQPQLSEYAERFPAFAVRLRRLFEIHAVMLSGDLKENEKTPPEKKVKPKPVNEIRFDLVNPPPLPPLKPPSHQQETFISDPPSPLGPATPPAT